MATDQSYRNRGSGRTPLSVEIRTSIALDAARGSSTSIQQAQQHPMATSNRRTSSWRRPARRRVSDHGLPPRGAASTSNRVAGYRAPEVTDTRKVSQKADVYSFGVLLLELLTGKAPTQGIPQRGGVDLPRWVQSVVREEWAAEVFDMELLRYQSVEEDMVRMLQLGVDCTAQYLIDDRRCRRW
ncbi:hypothetical protein HPP92_026739 [Vanilla planifolia]|uniref:Protein kinase domain-containing protein n=1 Tax=Vanilla planifolia TaxID=51239 RepID=A0A835PEA7_VANPL|nr:hypothetical protein HPP92_026739 [Vanilla planifolia]